MTLPDLAVFANVRVDVQYPWWLTGLALIGGLAFLTATFNLFFTLGRRPKELRAGATPPVDSDDFHRAIAGVVNAPFQRGGEAEVLDNGDAFFPAILQAIREAKHNINFMVYIWEPGEVSRTMAEALVQRAEAGIQVRLLLDGLGGIRAAPEEILALRKAGVEIHRFRPPVPGKLTRFHRRNHRRAIIVDGSIGFTGGAAVSDKWLGDADSPDHWRDTMVRVTGNLAAALQAAFAECWAATSGEVLAGREFYPRHVVDLPGDLEIARHVSVISSPGDEEHPLRYFYLLTFACARERIWVTTAYFVPDKHLRAVLRERAEAGVDVRLLLPNRHTDAKPIWWAGRSYYEELLRAGIRIFEYQPTFMHAKLAVVDGTWSAIGSANLDVRSKELNEENVLGICDRGFASRLEKSFLRDVEHALEIKLPSWRQRGLPARVLERLSVLFAEQY